MAIDKINYKGTEFDILPPVEIISEDDFFTNVVTSIKSCAICKQGDIINIQRLAFNYADYTKGDIVTVATINPLYLPKQDVAIRLLASTGGTAIDTIAWIEEGELRIYTDTTGNWEIFLFNTTYLAGRDVEVVE